MVFTLTRDMFGLNRARAMQCCISRARARNRVNGKKMSFGCLVTNLKTLSVAGFKA